MTDTPAQTYAKVGAFPAGHVELELEGAELRLDLEEGLTEATQANLVAAFRGALEAMVPRVRLGDLELTGPTGPPTELPPWTPGAVLRAQEAVLEAAKAFHATRPGAIPDGDVQGPRDRSMLPPKVAALLEAVDHLLEIEDGPL